MSGKYLLAIVASTLIFAACGDDVTEVTEVTEIHQEGMAVLEKGEDGNDGNDGADGKDGRNLIASPGTMGSFVDNRDGHVYKTVVIGSQTWMAENLNYSVSPNKQSWCGGGSGATYHGKGNFVCDSRRKKCCGENAEVRQQLERQ